MTAIYTDPNSSAYKKAQRHYIKSSQTLPSANQSAFRVQEKLYKTRFPRPSLEHVLDLSRGNEDEVEEAGWGRGHFDAAQVEPINLRLPGGSGRRAFRIPRISGE